MSSLVSFTRHVKITQNLRESGIHHYLIYTRKASLFKVQSCFMLTLFSYSTAFETKKKKAKACLLWCKLKRRTRIWPYIRVSIVVNGNSHQLLQVIVNGVHEAHGIVKCFRVTIEHVMQRSYQVGIDFVKQLCLIIGFRTIPVLRHLGIRNHRPNTFRIKGYLGTVEVVCATTKL